MVLLAFGTGIAAAMLATLAPLVSAFRAPAMDTVDEDALQPLANRAALRPRIWIAIGVVGLAVSGFVLVARPQAALAGVAALLVSMLALLPATLVGTLHALDRVRRRIASVVPPIAVGELQTARSRSVAIAAIAGVAVFGSTAIESAHRDLQRALDTASHQLSAVTDLWVSAAGQANTLATIPFPPRSISAIATAPHVAAVAAYRGALLDLGDRRVWVMAPPRGSTGMVPRDEVVAGDLRTADQHLDHGGWAVVSQILAKERDLHVGDAFTLDAPQPRRFRVAAITTNFGWSPGAIIVNADDFQRAWGSSDVSALQVRLDGLSPIAGKRLVERTLGPDSALTVETVGEREQRHRATTRAGLARLTQIATLMLTAATLAIGAAMGGMIWQRRRRMADLKLAGITQRQLWRALMLRARCCWGSAAPSVPCTASVGPSCSIGRWRR